MIQGYALTDDDWLWLLRAVQAEGPVREEVARALVNLWARARARGGEQSLAEIVRGYSQPVNPRWAHGGERDPDPSVFSQAEKRRAAASSLDAFEPGVASAVLAALTTPWASDVTDFAAPWVDASPRYIARSPAVRGRNRLWTRDESWGGYRVSTMTNAEKAAAIRQLAKALVPADRAVVEKALARLLSPGAVVGWNPLLEGVRVIRPGEPGYEEAKARAAQPGVDHDLAVANALDAMYRAVSDRVTQLGDGAIQVVERVSKPVSGLLWAAAFLGLVWLASKE